MYSLNAVCLSPFLLCPPLPSNPTVLNDGLKPKSTVRLQANLSAQHFEAGSYRPVCSLQPRSCPELSPAQTLCERNAGPRSWDCMCLAFVVCKISLFSFILLTLLFLLLMMKKCPSGRNMFLKNTRRFNLYFFFATRKSVLINHFPKQLQIA